MAQAFENAGIEEVRETPVITLVQAPRVPSSREPKRRVVTVLMGLIMGGVLALILAGVRDYYLRLTAEGRGDVKEFDRLWRETLRGLGLR